MGGVVMLVVSKSFVVALFIKTGVFKRTEEKRYKEAGCCSESCMADYQTAECLLSIAFV